MEQVIAGKGPGRSNQGRQKKGPSIPNAGDPVTNRGGAGPHSSKKGKKGYTRKAKHKGKDATIGDELTPMDETFRGMNFPLAQALNWSTEDDGVEHIAADLNWSNWKAETFDDTGEKGEHPAWGLKSIIDRGVRPHEKPSGAKRIEETEQTQKRTTRGKKFKSYSMVGAFYW